MGFLGPKWTVLTVGWLSKNGWFSRNGFAHDPWAEMGVDVFYRKQGSWTINLIALPCNDRNMTWANVWNVLDHHDADFVDPIDGMCPWVTLWKYYFLMFILELLMKIKEVCSKVALN